MHKNKKKLKNEVYKLSTQVVLVVEISEQVKSELLDIMQRLGIVRALTGVETSATQHLKLIGF